MSACPHGVAGDCPTCSEERIEMLRRRVEHNNSDRRRRHDDRHALNAEVLRRNPPAGRAS